MVPPDGCEQTVSRRLAPGTHRRRGCPIDIQSRFDRFASWSAHWTGHSLAFFSAVAITLAWALSGPLFGFSDTWQLVINTGTTVLTFLMVFVIQNTMNRDSAALHAKLDELVRASSDARDALIGAQDLDEEQIRKLDPAPERSSPP
jgi:low affinity Fe/Cu permease